nr:hypothetical protein [Tanacetum cinerariifolium]
KEEEKMMIKKDPPLDQTGGLKDKEKEVNRHQLALPLKGQPRVQADLQRGLNLDDILPSTSQSAHAEEPVQTTCHMEETPLPVYETGADDQPIIQTSQHPD